MFKGFGDDISLPSDAVPISDASGAQMYYSAEYGEMYVPDASDPSNPWSVYAVDNTIGLLDPNTGSPIDTSGGSGSSWWASLGSTIGTTVSAFLQYNLASKGIKPAGSITKPPPGKTGIGGISPVILIGGGLLLLTVVMKKGA